MEQQPTQKELYRCRELKDRLIQAAKNNDLFSVRFEKELENFIKKYENGYITMQELIDSFAILSAEADKRHNWLWGYGYRQWVFLRPPYTERNSGVVWREPSDINGWFSFLWCKICDNKPIGKCCGEVVYCSKECQTKDRENHKYECERK
jgi:hypothetical protein